MASQEQPFFKILNSLLYMYCNTLQLVDLAIALGILITEHNHENLILTDENEVKGRWIQPDKSMQLVMISSTK